MKNKLRALYLSLEAIFFAIVPTVILWLQYGENEAISNSYKISVTGIVVMVFMFLLVRRIWLKPEMEKWHDKIVNLETTSYSIANEEALEKARKEWKVLSYATFGINCVVPILFFVLSLFTIKAVEAQIIKLYGVLCICGVSLFGGIATKFIEIGTSKFKVESAEKNEKKDGKK